MLGGFNVELGMSGEKFSYGEEAELQRRLRTTKSDVFIYYDPELYIYHLVRPEKMTWRYIIYSRFAGGRHIHSVFREDNPQATKLSQLKLLSQALLTLLRFLVGLVGVVYNFGLLLTLRRMHQYPGTSHQEKNKKIICFTVFLLSLLSYYLKYTKNRTSRLINSM